MNAEELGQLLKERPERLNDVESFAEFIHEAYPNETGNANIMTTAYRAGVISMLDRNNSAEWIADFLAEDYGLAEEKVLWAAELWRDAHRIFAADTGIKASQRKDIALKGYEVVWEGAHKGITKAQYKLGNCYYFGHGVQRDYGEAAKWFRLTAEQGDTAAQSNLGFCYLKGYGVLRNRKERKAEICPLLS